jgi:hypothetical protein
VVVFWSDSTESLAKHLARNGARPQTKTPESIREHTAKKYCL